MKTLRCAPALFDKDLSSKTYIVTGANSGAGLATTEQLVKQGAHVVVMGAKDGAQTQLHCLLDDDVPAHNGAYYSQNPILYADKKDRAGGWPMTSPNPHAHDDDLAAALVAKSSEMVGLDVSGWWSSQR